MAQAAALAGQFVIRTAAAAAPHLASATASYAASQALTAAQNLVFGPIRQETAGPRREDIRFLGASEGAGIPRVYGRQRVGGQVIWASGITERTEVTEQSSGGKGVTRSVEQRHTAYKYSVSIAIGLCEGEVSRIARVWADGRLVSLKDYDVRFYTGDEAQEPDPLIEASEGIGNAPAFRGLAYLVIEDLPLESFGNRIPQFNFEIERPLTDRTPEALENLATAVTLIPGSGESAYAHTEILREIEEGTTQADNVHNGLGQTDAKASIDHLTTALPNLEAVSLVVSWFGTDLRAGECLIEPRIESRDRTLLPREWSVAGRDRASANEVSRIDGAPAYGGTPDDESVREMLTALKARGLKVMFHPFVLMDIPAGNNLPDPEGGASQAAYPWRGRITASPRASADGTAAARTQVEAFFGHYRQMVLHYAELCAAVGGVDRFLLGSELRGLTQLRDESGAYPATEALIVLAADIRAILGAETEISYGADWSEYGAYQPADGSGDVLFPLDALWADGNVDFVGIDNYMPLTDWRDGGAHLDAGEAKSPYEEAYLQSRIAGGENFDWYYTDDAARESQLRTPISDTTHGEDWVFRSKDLAGWWSNPHHERPGGVRAAIATPWVPGTKPIVFTEIGCAAIDKGANQPNVFLDPKSAESAVPYFSSGDRDDLAARSFLEAHLTYWADPDNNPVSVSYSGQMVDAAGLYIYAWDARPFPDFPLRSDVWSDAENWVTGHWLNGRAGRVPLSALIEAVAADSGLAQVDASACRALVDGYRLGEPMSARAALEPLLDLYQLDATERAGVLIVRPRDGTVARSVIEDDMVITGDAPPLSLSRSDETGLPAGLSLTYTDGLGDYQASVATATDPGARGQGTFRLDTAVVLEAGEAEGRAEALLAERRALRETAEFALPADDMALEPADVLEVAEASGAAFTCRITQITDGPYRAVEAVRTGPGLFAPRYTGLSGRAGSLPPIAGPAVAELLDIPLLPAGEDGAFLRGAAFASPWPGQVDFYRAQGTEPPFAGAVTAPATMGRLLNPLDAGPIGRWDRGNSLRVRLFSGSLASLTEETALGGRGLAAVRSSIGSWELLIWRRAVLQEDGSWLLSDLLRGRRGTEDEALAGAPANARIVFFLNDLGAEPLDPSLWGTEAVWQAGPATKLPGAFPYRAIDVRLEGSGARPFAPVHLRAEASGGDLNLRWVRRTRIGGDSWQAGDVALGEATERYRVRGLDAVGAVITEAEVSEPSAILPAAGLARVEVAQISASFGPGRPAVLALG